MSKYFQLGYSKVCVLSCQNKRVISLYFLLISILCLSVLILVSQHWHGNEATNHIQVITLTNAKFWVYKGPYCGTRHPLIKSQYFDKGTCGPHNQDLNGRCRCGVKNRKPIWRKYFCLSSQNEREIWLPTINNLNLLIY